MGKVYLPRRSHVQQADTRVKGVMANFVTHPSPQHSAVQSTEEQNALTE